MASGLSWKKADQLLTSNGYYLLDDEWHDYGGCDVTACQPAENPYSAMLVESEKVGERTPPGGDGTILAPEFHSAPLHGKVRITLESYSEKDCQRRREIHLFVEN